MTYFIGDLHLFNQDMLLMENRPYKNVDEMNIDIVKKINSTVGANDTCYLLGDVADCDDEVLIGVFLDKIKCHKKMVMGNHDIPHVDFYRRYFGADFSENPIILNNFWMISHEPMYVTMRIPYANVFAHVHQSPMYRSVSPRSFCVSWDRLGGIPVSFEHIMEEVRKANGN